jgi:threonine/homoserine/homoserine lactone efflux protein
MPSNFILLYITTVFIASILPGPSMLLALTHGMQFGSKLRFDCQLVNCSVALVAVADGLVCLEHQVI